MQKQNEGVTFSENVTHMGAYVHGDNIDTGTGRRSKAYEELEFTDDFMFCKILENNPKLCKELAEIITGEKFGEIKTDEGQKSIRIIPNEHGVRFDVYLSDGKTIADIEMQTELKDNLPKRSRYYQSVVDVADLEKNTDYKFLKKSFIIFITLENPFPDYNLRKYTFVNVCREDKRLELGDDAVKIFLTPDGKKGGMSEEMEALMKYVAENKAESDFTKELDEQIRIAKSGRYWRKEYMQMRERIDAEFSAGKKEGIIEGKKKGIIEGKKEGKKEGNREGRRDQSIETAERMLAKGKYDPDEISELTGVSLEDVKRLAKSK